MGILLTDSRTIIRPLDLLQSTRSLDEARQEIEAKRSADRDNK